MTKKIKAGSSQIALAEQGNNVDLNVEANSFRPAVQVIARLIATDRRAVLLANDKAQVLLANTPAKKLGLTPEALRKDLSWAQLCEQARRAGSAAVSVAIKNVHLEGELVHLHLGSANGYLLRLSDSDQEATWLRNRARAATLMRVAHDLRTPIQSLAVLAESMVAEQGADNAKSAQFSRAAELALDHINNVLGVIRGEHRVSGLQPDEEFSPANEPGTLIEMLRPIATSRGAEVRTKVKQIVGGKVVGPLRFVRALFQNMIDNSLKYGGPEIDVTLTMAPLASSLEDKDAGNRIAITLEVQDLGGGLPEDQKQRLGAALGQSTRDPQRPRRMSERQSGGLNILAHAVQQLGGRVELLDRHDSEDMAEARVIGTILRATFSLEQVTEADSATHDQGQADPSVHADTLDDVSILVVEDSPASREWLTRILLSAGARVDAVGSGTEALTFLEDASPSKQIDLILSDLTLPNMSGIEFARRAQALSESKELSWSGRIMGLTAHADEKIENACIAAGMVRVLEKPIRPAKLFQAVNEVIHSAQPRTVSSVGKPGQRDQRLRKAKSPFDEKAVAELVSAFTLEGAKGFMLRALAEAEQALHTLLQEGVTDNTGCMLHAATGACSLSGLSEIEKVLRKLEDAVSSEQNELDSLLSQLGEAIENSASGINMLRS